MKLAQSLSCKPTLLKEQKPQNGWAMAQQQEGHNIHMRLHGHGGKEEHACTASVGRVWFDGGDLVQGSSGTRGGIMMAITGTGS